jgi:hypothetical protein
MYGYFLPFFVQLIILLCSHDRAIVLEPGNPSMKSQIKALAAVEGNFSFASCIYDLIFPEFLSFQIAILVYHWAEKLEKKNLDDVVYGYLLITTLFCSAKDFYFCCI